MILGRVEEIERRAFSQGSASHWRAISWPGLASDGAERCARHRDGADI
jgi:hypothetical protein